MLLLQQRPISGHSYQLTKISRQFQISGQFQDTFKFSGISGQLGPLNYSDTSNNMKLVHWPLTGGLFHLVQQEVDWVGPQPALYQM